MSEYLSPDLSALEAALRGLTPAGLGAARDRVLFEAGRRSARPVFWRMATAAAGALCLFLAVPSSGPPTNRVEISSQAPIAPGIVVKSDRVPVAEHRPSVFELLLLGAPNYLPAESPRTSEIESWLHGGPSQEAFPQAAGRAASLDRSLGLPPGTLGNPLRAKSAFGPIRRGDSL